jgi:hypothetical protein
MYLHSMAALHVRPTFKYAVCETYQSSASLPECGHTFCQSCLVDWFNTTLAQHMTAYPNYNHNIHNQPFNTLVTDCIAHRNMNPHIQFHLQALLPHLQLEVPAPQFTCPTCRKQVKTRPVEDFALKSIVRAIAGAAGESSPKKQGGRQRSGAGRPQDTWEGFFRTPV